METKLAKVPPSKVLASVESTEYVVLSSGQVARLLKPVVVNKNRYYNIVVNGKLRRVTEKSILKIAEEIS